MPLQVVGGLGDVITQGKRAGGYDVPGLPRWPYCASEGFVANFHWRRFVIWSLLVTRSIKRRRAMMAVSFKGVHFPKDIILMGVRWYVAYLLSYRHIEELMEERGVEVDHSTIQRWVVKYSPSLEEAFHRRKQPG